MDSTMAKLVMCVVFMTVAVGRSMASPAMATSDRRRSPQFAGLQVQHYPYTQGMPLQQLASVPSTTTTHPLSAFVMEATRKAQKLLDSASSQLNLAHAPHSSDSSDGSGSISSKLQCLACKAIVKAGQFIVWTGATVDQVGNLSAQTCTKLKLASQRDCQAIGESWKAQIVYVFSQGSLDAVSGCSSLLQQDCDSSASAGGDQWTVPLPDVPKPDVLPVPMPEAEAASIRVLQVTDFHIDSMYVAGSKTDCGDTLCCHANNGNGTTPSTTAGPFGTYSCDTPFATVESLLAHASANQKVDYILWTGDDSPHNFWNHSTSDILWVIDKMSALLEKYFPNTPIFPSVGNHEGYPVDSFPPPFAASVANMDWLYGPLNRTWSRWLPVRDQPTISQTILKGGFYSALVFPGLRVISLNMNYCNSLNLFLLVNSTDPLGQLSWLAGELQASENRGEKVHIVGHIPPGTVDCLADWSDNYNRIINRYEDTVRAQFFGHTHYDEFEVFYDVPSNNKSGDSKPRPTNVAFISPSVTTYDYCNPAYRIYTVDGNHPSSTWAVLDHETYFANLTESNLNDKLKWYLLYKAKDAYQMESLQPSEWNRLIDRMQTDDWLFGLYYRHYHRASEAFSKCVTDQCRQSHLCDLRTSRSGDRHLCPRSPTQQPDRL